ncbi:hypothetical protein [Mycolicibacterium sphagni]|uniref:hypothetical protein n=1 Tax=Mycolicibacterium sphagni TaxID=1786 RepID=UPI001F2956C3|nr:hypothetical protein [Mycolicibacterium sphagni]
MRDAAAAGRAGAATALGAATAATTGSAIENCSATAEFVALAVEGEVCSRESAGTGSSKACRATLGRLAAGLDLGVDVVRADFVVTSDLAVDSSCAARRDVPTERGPDGADG